MRAIKAQPHPVSFSVAERRQSIAAAAAAAVLGAVLLLPASVAFAQENAVADALAKREQAYAAAQELLDNEQYREAVTAYSQLVTAFSYTPQPYLGRAEAYIGIENYESALIDLNNAMTYANNSPQLQAEAQIQLGKIYLEQNNVGDALENLEAAAGDIEETPELKFLLGKARVLSGQPGPGAETLTEYLELEDPEFEDREIEVYRLRAQAYAGLRKFDEANEDLDRAIQVEPTDHENYQAKASVLMAQEDFQAAADAFTEVIKYYEPADENDDLPPLQAYLARAAAMEEVGRAAESGEQKTNAYGTVKSQVEEFLDLLPDRPELAGIVAAAQFRLGVAERLLGDLPAAIKALTASIDANPQADPAFLGQVYYRRGICFYYLDEDNLALLDFEAAAGRLVEDPRPNLWKGRTYTKLDKYIDAIRAYGEAIAVSDRYADAFTHRGLAYFSLEEYDKAIVDFNSAIRLKPTVGRPYYYRGVTHSELGDSEKAITSLTNAIRFDPELVVAYRALAAELRKTGQGSLAGEYERRAAELGG